MNQISRFLPARTSIFTAINTRLQQRSRSLCLALCITPFALGLTPALAQDGNPSSETEEAAESERAADLGTMVVTVRRIEEVAEDVPLSITAFEEEDIIRMNITEVEDVARLTPGVTFDIGGFPNDTRPAVRGMQAERGRPSVAIMLDGLDLSGENLAISGGGAGVVPDLVDLERIEIVKGPQTTLYGRSAFAGAINYISKRPSEFLEGRAELELAEYGHRRFAGMISGPIADDLLAYRINAVYREQDGFWTNPVNGGPLGAEEFQGIAGMLRFTPGDDWDINLRYKVSSTDNSDYPTAQLPANVRRPVPGGTFTAGPPGSPALPCPGDLSGQPAPIVGACTRGTVVGPLVADIDDIQMGFNELTGEPPRGLELDEQVFSLDSRWDTDFGTFRYTFGWIDDETFVEADGDFTNFDAPPGLVFSLSALQILDFKDERIDHNFFWTESFGSVDLLLGAQYLEEESTLINSSSFWVRNPDSPLGGPPFFLNTQQTETEFPVRISRDTEYSAVFGKLNWRITDNLRLGLEARYNSDDITYDVSGWRLQDVSLRGLDPVCLPDIPQGAIFMGVPGPDVPPPGTVQACPQSASLSYDEWTPRVTLDWQLNDSVMLYGNVARGFKPGGFNANELIDFAGQGYLPEFLDAYEVGFKTYWRDLRLVLDGAAFYNDYTDQQIGVQLNQTGAGDTIVAIPGITNAGQVDSRGFEVAANWRPTDRFNFNLAYAYTDATFEEYVQGPSPTAGPDSFALCGVPEGQTSSPQIRAEAGNACADFSGNRVPKNPKHAFNFGALYRAPFGDKGNTWFIELMGQYRSKRFLSEDNLAWMPSYTNYDLQVGLDFDRFSVIGFVTNLTDDDTIRSAQRNVDPGSPEGFAPGRAVIAYLPEPRVAGVRFIYRFERF